MLSPADYVVIVAGFLSVALLAWFFFGPRKALATSVGTLVPDPFVTSPLRALGAIREQAWEDSVAA